jgi:putative transposase
MARRVRLEDAGNLYHVINRGNYRRDVFETEGAKEAFADTLDEGCRRYGWVVHAYVIMRNHFHLALETPEPNLADGMHWLGGTFATRFNRYRKERGHLFQGRYQSLLIEDAAALARVGAYVHLNPVRAQVVGPGEVASFRWSSLFRFVGTEARPPWLQARDLLRPLGGADDSAGWKTYIGYLAAIAEDEEAQERMEFSRMSKGWAIGTAGWRRAVAKELGQRALAVGLSESELREHKELRWQSILVRELVRRRRSPEDVGEAPASARWKREVALQLRKEGGAPFRWIAERLGMGSGAAVRVSVHRFARECNM